MVLKKRIKIKPRPVGFASEAAYMSIASLCPICGTSIEDERKQCMIRNFTEDFYCPKAEEILYVAMRRTITFFCPTCGCSWSVKRFERGKAPK